MNVITNLTLTICISFGLLYLVLYGSKFVNHDATLIFCFIYKWVELHSNYINYQVSALPMPEESSLEFWIWGSNSNKWLLGYCRFQWCGFYLCPCSKDSLNIQLVPFSLQSVVKQFYNSCVHIWLLMTWLMPIWSIHNFARLEK